MNIYITSFCLKKLKPYLFSIFCCSHYQIDPGYGYISITQYSFIKLRNQMIDGFFYFSNLSGILQCYLPAYKGLSWKVRKSWSILSFIVYSTTLLSTRNVYFLFEKANVINLLYYYTINLWVQGRVFQ